MINHKLLEIIYDLEERLKLLEEVAYESADTYIYAYPIDIDEFMFTPSDTINCPEIQFRYVGYGN